MEHKTDNRPWVKGGQGRPDWDEEDLDEGFGVIAWAFVLFVAFVAIVLIKVAASCKL